MRPMVAFIATANKSAPITQPLISNENGAIAAARRATTSLSARYFSETCGWARTSQTLARAHRLPKNHRRRAEVPVRLQHLRHKERRHRARRVHKQLRRHRQRKERRSLARPPKPRGRRVRRLHPPVRLEQHLSDRPGVRRQHRPRRRPGLRLSVRLHQMRHRRRDSGPALLLHHPDKWRTLLREEAALWHQARKLPARHGRSRLPVCRQCILPRGIMCIFMRRAASILIQTCQRTVSSTKNDASPESVLQKHCNFRIQMRHRKAGKLFPRTMQNALWLI